MFWQLALLAGQAYLGIVTQRRPVKSTFEEFLEANKGDETRPIPYIRGRWKTTPQRIWLGDFSARQLSGIPSGRTFSLVDYLEVLSVGWDWQRYSIP